MYKIIIPNWNSGLNELLNHQEKRWNSRTHRMLVYNSEKTKNDRLCRNAIQKAGLSGVKLNPPIAINYVIYAKDKRHDRDNSESALKKSFQDALQELKMISNDGYDYILDSTEPTHTYIDRVNPRAEITIIEIKNQNEKEKK